MRVEQFGDASATKAIAAQDAKDGKKAERISYGLMLIILLVAFGALVAAGVPLCSAPPPSRPRSACSGRSASSTRCPPTSPSSW